MEHNETVNRIFLYGLDDEYRVIRYTYIHREDVTISRLGLLAESLKITYPDIVMIFAVDNSYEIYRACHDAMKKRSVEDRVLFKGMLEKDGIRVV